MGTKCLGTVCPGGPIVLGTICPWGPNVWGPIVQGDQLSWGPFVHGDQMSRDCLFLGTNCGGPNVRGLNVFGTKWEAAQPSGIKVGLKTELEFGLNLFYSTGKKCNLLASPSQKFLKLSIKKYYCSVHCFKPFVGMCKTVKRVYTMGWDQIWRIFYNVIFTRYFF